MSLNENGMKKNRVGWDSRLSASAQNQMSLLLIEKRCTCHVDPPSMQIQRDRKDYLFQKNIEPSSTCDKLMLSFNFLFIINE